MMSVGEASCAPLPAEPPFVWPEPRWLAGQVRYESNPPFEPLLAGADLIAGVLVGVSDGTIKWLQKLMGQAPSAGPTAETAPDIIADAAKLGVTGVDEAVKGLHESFGGAKLHKPRQVRIVVLVYPAGPTQEDHLNELKKLQATVTDEQRTLEVRLLPTKRAVGAECEKVVLPPTQLLAQDEQADKTWFCIGSVGDAGHDAPTLVSFNAVFQPDAALCDQWRRWFQYLFGCAAPLTQETVRIPALVPAQGDLAADVVWAEFEKSCRGADGEGDKRPAVDPKTGEVTKPDGSPVEPWDKGIMKLDPLAQELQKVYAAGCLATVDETTRIKPLAIPVKATLLGEKAERAVGAVTQKQSFSLAVLDAGVAVEVEKCRNVADILELLGYQLSKGNRWIPDMAKPLLKRELEARNKQGMARLNEVLTGKRDAPEGAEASASVKEYIKNRKDKLKHDLDGMYRELHRGDAVPPEKLAEVLANVEARLTAALGARITPRVNYNRLAPPALTETATDEQWSQPFSLLLQSARLLRTSLTDAFFSRNFNKKTFTQSEFESAMSVFGDTILKSPDKSRAEAELKTLKEIEESAWKIKDKCHAVWRLITGTAP